MKIVSAFVLSLLLIIPNMACADEKIKGNYKVIGDIEKLKGAKQIEIKEFFNYSCGHCYRFLATVKTLKKKYKDKFYHKKFPIYWGNQTPYPARAYYIADNLGIEERFTQELFDTNFKLNINIFQPRVIQFLAKDYGVAKEMKEAMKDPAIQAKVQKSLDMAKQYGADETPTIIINDVLKVAPSLYSGSVDEMTKGLEQIFDDILSYN